LVVVDGTELPSRLASFDGHQGIVDDEMLPDYIKSIADVLANQEFCPNKEVLAELRTCWSDEAINPACQLLPIERRSQIEHWLSELDATNKVSAVQKAVLSSNELLKGVETTAKQIGDITLVNHPVDLTIQNLHNFLNSPPSTVETISMPLEEIKRLYPYT
jgi:hypothetical protein